MFKDFLDSNARLTQNTGIAAGVAALFLNVAKPGSEASRLALGNVQIFFLSVFAICLTVLAWRFVRFLFKKEKAWNKRYDFPRFILPATTAFMLLWIILNLLRYIIDIYPASFEQFIGMTLPIVLIMIFFVPVVYIEMHPEKFTLFSKIVVLSFLLSSVFAFLGAMVQGFFLKYIYFYWAIGVLPGLFIVIFLTGVIIALTKKQKLFSLEKA
jgi:hypothetical protein